MGVRLNLGSGAKDLAGYENLDAKNGRSVYPLTEYPDGCADEVRASHLLEHFANAEVVKVVKEWLRVLKPGGLLRIAVPDAKRIAELYLDTSRKGPLPVEPWLMGGQTDALDYHKTIWDRDKLRALFRHLGMYRIEQWTSEGDCAALPISLNLQARKATADQERKWKVEADISVPRLGFMDNFVCCFEALIPNDVIIRRQTGAFWGQCLERGMGISMENNADIIITIDYDSVFDASDVAELVWLMKGWPEIDALASIQVARGWKTPLATFLGPDGKNRCEFPREYFDEDTCPATTAHFGLTAIRVASLKKLPHPWFLGQPNDKGEWGEGRVDDDIYFWRQWKKHGMTLHLANRVVIGHIETVIRWPDRNFNLLQQGVSEYQKDRQPPEDVWR
jgi:predicted SAM-dependent methyltransferase